MRILIDMDEVLADLLDKWLSVYNKDYNDTLTKEGIKSWDTNKWVKPECGKKIYDYLTIPGFFRDLKPLPGAVESVKAMQKMGHEVEIVSAAMPETMNDKYKWLEENFPTLNPKKQLHFTHRKGLFRGDALIDDGVHNLRDFFVANRGQAKCIVVDYPHNKDIDFPVIRVKGLPDVVDLLKRSLTIRSF